MKPSSSKEFSVLVKTDKFLPIEFLKETVYYKDGILYWKKSRGSRSKVGTPCGYTMKTGYMETCFVYNGIKVRHYNHRIIYAMYHNKWPTKVIDHIDRDKSNNKIENLREVTDTESNLNTSRKSDLTNTRNISRHTDGYQVEFTRGHNRTRKFFKDLDEAKKYRDKIKRGLDT